MTSAKPASVPHAVRSAIRNRKQILYICSHPQLLEQRKRQMIEASGGYIGIRWELLPQFADRLLQGSGQAYVRIDQSIREDLTESVMLRLETRGGLMHLRHALGNAGMVKSIALWIEDLEKGLAGACGAYIRESRDPLLAELWNIYEVYREHLQDPSFPYKETEQIFSIVTDMLQKEISADAFPYDLVVLDGYFARSPEEEKLVDTIRSKARKAVTVTLGSVFDSPASIDVFDLVEKKVRWLTGQTVQQEVSMVVTGVQSRIEAGEVESEHLVVAPNAAYARYVKRECAAKGVRVQGERTISLLQLPETQRLLSLLQLRQSGWSRRSFMSCALLYGPLMGLSESDIAWGRETITASGVLSDEAEWLGLFYAAHARSEIRLRHLQGMGDAEQVKERGQHARKWIRLVHKLQRVVNAVPVQGSWPDLLKAVLLLVDEDEKLASRSIMSREPAYESIRRKLRFRLNMALVLCPHERGNVQLARFVLWWKARMMASSLPAGREDRGIRVCLPQEAYGLSGSHVYILGLTEGCFPRSFDPHWIWQLVSRVVSSAAPHIPGPEAQMNEDRMFFRWAVQVGCEEIVLSAALVGERGHSAVISCLAKECFGLTEVEQSVVENGMEAGRKDMFIHGERIPVALVPFFTDDPVISITGLDLYGKCGFRFFAERVLAVRESLSREKGLLPLDAGQIAHGVMRELFSENTTGTSKDYIARAGELLEHSINAFAARFRLSGGRWEAQCRILQDEIRYFISKEAGRYTEKAVLEWGFGQVHAEKMDLLSCESPFVLKKEGMEIKLTGTVDRIDLSETAFEVVDYKRSSAPKFREIERGEDLQLALYMMAYHGLTGDNRQPSGGRYAVIRDPEAGEGIKFSDWSEFQKFAKKITERVFELAGRLVRGDVAPHPRNPAICQTCSYRGVCRRDEAVWEGRV